MKKPELQQADPEGGITIPELADELVSVVQVSSTEFRISKVETEEEIEFLEEKPIILSARDSEVFLAALDGPAREPNAALRRAVENHKKRHG